MSTETRYQPLCVRRLWILPSGTRLAATTRCVHGELVAGRYGQTGLGSGREIDEGGEEDAVAVGGA